MLTKTLYFSNYLFLPTVLIKHTEHITAIHKNCTRLLLFVCLILNGLVASSQQKDSLQLSQQDSLQSPQQDTVRKEFVSQLKQLGFSEVKKGMRKFEEDRIEMKQEQSIEGIQKTMQAATDYIEIGIDTTGLNEEQADIDNWYNIVIDGVLINKGSNQTKGNLEVWGKF